MEAVRFVDTTLRDGEQAPGVAFTVEEKIEIARMLDRLGIHQIEAGVPAMGGIEVDAVTRIAGLGLQAVVSTWNRANIGDIQASLACGVKHVHISAPVSDLHIHQMLRRNRVWVVESMRRAVSYAREHGLAVTVGAEDASRADWKFLLHYAGHAKKAGAQRLRLADTVGILEPFRTRELVGRIIAETGMEVEFHAHNDFGLATANTFAAWRAGARYLDTTIVGLGERAGNAALEEVAMALKYLANIDLNFKTEQFRRLAEYVSMAARRELPAWKAVVGSNMFAHESGIHADGALKNPLTYEVMTPEEVGLERQIVIGKHSGTAAIKAKLAAYGIDLEEEDAAAILAKVRKLAVELKRPLSAKELVRIYEDCRVE